MKVIHQQKFSSNELIDLDSFLRNQTGDMSLVKAHGFMTAIVSFPDMFMPSEWIPLLVGELKYLEDQSCAQKMLDKLMTMYKQITNSLGSNRMFEFLLSADQPNLTLDNAPYSYIQEWLHSDEKFITQACATFFMLTDLIKSTDYKKDKSKLIKNLPELVKALYIYWSSKQNEIQKPCPCGSTKQFNRCCLLEKASAVLH
jgi:yecA family protein